MNKKKINNYPPICDRAPVADGGRDLNRFEPILLWQSIGDPSLTKLKIAAVGAIAVMCIVLYFMPY